MFKNGGMMMSGMMIGEAEDMGLTQRTTTKITTQRAINGKQHVDA